MPIYVNVAAKIYVHNIYYRQLLEPHNTPFSNKTSAAPARRLWNYLVHQEPVQDIFIRAVFGKRRSSGALDEEIAHTEANELEPVRIIHKDQDSIAAFCLNQVEMHSELFL